MGLATIIGLVLGFGALIGGYIMEGGTPASLIAPTAAIIVIGGTLAATIAGNSMDDVKNMPKLLMMAFKSPPDHRHYLVTEMVELAELARRDGLLALENRQIEQPFLKRSIMLVVDGTDPDTTRDILSMDIEAMEERHKHGYSIFTGMGAYAPTMGIIGTVMGLVHVLGHLENPDTLGHSIAVAFIATLYGVMTANVIFLPIGAKLKMRSHHEVLEKTMIVEGTLAIQAGDNPRVLKEKLGSYIPTSQRDKKVAPKGAPAPAGAAQAAQAGD